MGARRGKDYLEGLRDQREVWVGKQRVCVLEHPAFAGSLSGIAGYFDWQHEHASECLVTGTDGAGPIGVSHVIPKSRDHLRQRAVGLERLARYSMGALGRTPDYVSVTLAGFAGRPDVF